MTIAPDQLRRTHRLALLLALLAATAVPCRLFAQRSTDTATWRRTAVQLNERADSLMGGDGPSLRGAIDLMRQAAALFGKLHDRTNQATDFNYLGMLFMESGELDSSIAYFRKTRTIRRALGDRVSEAGTLRDIGSVFGRIGSKDSAIVYDRLALAMTRAVGDSTSEAETLNNFAVLFDRIGQRDSAMSYYRQALLLWRATDDTDGVATALGNIGSVFGAMGHPDSTLAYMRQALSMVRATGGRMSEATVLQNIGSELESIGQIDSALVYLRQALSITQNTWDRVGAIVTLGDIGAAFDDIGQSDSALAYHRQAAAIARTIGDRTDEAIALGNMNIAFTALGQNDSALVHSRQALALQRAVGDRPGEAATLTNLAAGFDMENQLDSALAYEREALSIKRAVGDRTGEATSLHNIGELFVGFARPDSALAYERWALPIYHAAGDQAGEAATLASIGTIFRWGRRADSASMYYDRATALYAGISRRAGGEINQLSYNETTAHAFAGWMVTWTDVVERGDSRLTSNAGYSALAAAERGRAQALRQLMATARDVPVGADLSREGRTLAARIVRSAAAALVYSASGDTLVIWLIPAHGAIITSVQRISHTQLDTLVAAMRYGVAGGDTRPNRGRGDPLDPTTLPADVVARALADSGRTLRRDVARILLPAVIREALPASGELIVVPHGGLSLIPFGLLPVDSLGTALLGDRLALRYGPSLTAIIDAEDRTGLDTARATDRARQLAPALIVGDPTMPPPFRLAGKSYALSDLPAARDEGRAVADSLGAPQWLTGDRATESIVRDQLPAARLVHLATHGIVFSSDAHTRLSFVALAPDSQHDGHLSVGTILDSLSLHAELVVLSACQTAVGDIKSAEGTLGLQRAMLAKGARSVLVSLWNVSDLATLFLVQSFYHHWLHDPGAPTKSEALRLAQADVRAEGHNPARPDRGDWGDPFYWAAFQLVGAP